MLPGGSCAAVPLHRWYYTLLGFVCVEAMLREAYWCVEYVAMARAGLVTVVLVGIHGHSVTRRLWCNLHFQTIFVAYVSQAGLDPDVTRFFYLNGLLEWGSTPGDHLFPDGGRINVVLFEWLFSAAELDYFDQWGVPSPPQGGVCCRAALNAERRRLQLLGYIGRIWVLDDRRAEFIPKLFGTHHCNFHGRGGHKEVILTQMEVIRKSGLEVQVGFFGTSINTGLGWLANGYSMVFIG